MKKKLLRASSILLVIILCGVANTKNKYSIELRDTALRDAIRLLVRSEDGNVIIPDDITGSVTASFPKTHINQALEQILAAKKLGMIKKNNIMRITQEKELKLLGKDLVTKTFNLKFGKAQNLKNQINPLLTDRGTVTVDERTNSLTIRDEISGISGAQGLINSIDRADTIVLIQTQIVEASTDFARELGTEWGFSFNNNMVSLNRSSPGMPDGLSVGLRPLSTMSIEAALSFAEEEGKVKTISRPSITTMSNRPATISSGYKFYVRTPGNFSVSSGGSADSGESNTESSSSSAGSGGNLQEIEAGISMIVTPQINDDNSLSLAIDVSSSQPDFAKAIEGIPAVADNSASTVVRLKNGETTVIGGLFQTQGSQKERGIPLLRKIPILGALFAKDTTGEMKKELLIFIRPTIMSDSNFHDAREILKDVELSKEFTTDNQVELPRLEPVNDSR